MQGVSGIASRFFACLAREAINIIMITQASSEHSITVAVMQNDNENAKAILEEEFSFEIKRKLVDPIRVYDSNSIIAIIGSNMINSPGVAGTLFLSLIHI